MRVAPWVHDPEPVKVDSRVGNACLRQRRRGCLEITAEASRTGLALITWYSTIRDLLVLASSASCKRRS